MPEKIAIVQGDDSWTYARLAAEVRRVCRGFSALGIAPGERIVLHLGNCVQAAIACWAGMSIGATVVPLNTNTRPAEVSRMLHRLTPALYLGHADLEHIVEDAGHTVLHEERRFFVDDASQHYRRLDELEDFGTTGFG